VSEELEIFLEDCEDQLSLMESALVDMQNVGVSEDSVGAVFRAMHTIKGSAGMFGFDDIVKFAHVAENLLDSVRQGDVTVTPDMVDLFLACQDHVEKLIEAETNETKVDEDEAKVGKALLEKLLSCMPKEEEEESSQQNQESVQSDAPLYKWHISIRFDKSFFTTGMSIHSIFNFLNNMGTIIINEPILTHIPLLEEINPTDTYIGFELQFSATSTQAEIEEVFEFVRDDVNLIIFHVEDQDELINLIKSREEETLGCRLVNRGFFTKEMLSECQDLDNKPCDVEECIEITPQKMSTVEPKIVDTIAPPIPDTTLLHPIKENKKAASKEPQKKKSSASLRVDSTKIDQLINHMSEIIIANSKILSLVEEEENTELEEASNRMRELLEYVRDGIMDMRMVQVGDSFAKYHRIVNDTAKKIGKDIDFIISGEDTELDKTVIERISDPLVHMLRNSIDHGIELPEDRLKKGKSAKGRVDLRAYPDSGTIVIEIEDDGKGLDKDRILSKAIENGQVEPSANLSDNEIYKLIFAAGLSTADKVSDISGRGVGMDVVRRNIEDLRGTIDITSAIDKGSKLTIRLPLTLAIIDGFLVQVGETKYIIPLESIQECIELTSQERANMKGNEFINLRGEMLPIMNVREHLNEQTSSSNRQNIVIVHFGEKMIGLLVDELLGEHQTVIKPLGEVFENVPGISGGSILGSGEVALIFDIARLIEYKI
jgi:two-component system, chemotaxis family, sensor kinase CheA